MFSLQYIPCDVKVQIAKYLHYFQNYFTYKLNSEFLPLEAAVLARYCDRNSVRLSVCPSLIRVKCDETKEHTIDILTPKPITLVLTSTLIGENVPFQLKFVVKLVTTHFEKRRLRPISAFKFYPGEKVQLS